MLVARNPSICKLVNHLLNTEPPLAIQEENKTHMLDAYGMLKTNPERE